MGIFSSAKYQLVHLSPEVRGRLSVMGLPLAGMRVQRELFYDRHYLDTSVTDERGCFSFPAKAIEARIPAKAYPRKPVTQIITVDHQGESHLLWRTSTDRLTQPAVLVELLQKLHCDLSVPETLQHFPARESPSLMHNIRTVCRWDSR